MKTRREKLLDGLDLSQTCGVEIGPLSRPLINRPDGNVIYVDCMDVDALRRKYAADPTIDVDRIQVDVIWGALSLKQAIGAHTGNSAQIALDYVLASHVIEHVPDLVTWLQEIRAILKTAGEVRLAIPDRRFTFDHLRRNSDLPSILAAHVQKARIPNTHCILDFCLNETPVDALAAWEGRLDAATLAAQHVHTIEGAFAVARDALLNGNYHDVHCWAFTPASFARVCIELAENDLLDFSCTQFYDSAFGEIEFFVTMQACDSKAEKLESWTRMASMAAAHGVD